MPSKLSLFGLLAASAVVTATAVADPAPRDAVKLRPPVAGKPTSLEIQLGSEVLEREGRREPPRAFSLLGTRGLAINTQAVRRRCSDEQADRFDCPRSSSIGGGRAEGRAEGVVVPGGRFDFSAGIEMFLAPPRQQNDTAGVVISVHEPETNRRFNIKGRIRQDERYGYETRFEGLDAAASGLPPGVTIRLTRLELKARASRTIKRRVTVRRNGERRRVTRRSRLTLLRNPRRCRGEWPYRVNIEYAAVTDTYDGAVQCRKR